MLNRRERRIRHAWLDIRNWDEVSAPKWQTGVEKAGVRFLIVTVILSLWRIVRFEPQSGSSGKQIADRSDKLIS